MKRFISLVVGLLTVFFAIISAFVYPKGRRQKEVVFVAVMQSHQLPKRYVKRAEYQIEHKGRTLSGKLFITQSMGSFIALSPVCTHLGCLVNWDSINKEFLCPCHAGRYDQTGLVISGPPSQPLKRLPLEIRGDTVYVGITL